MIGSSAIKSGIFLKGRSKSSLHLRVDRTSQSHRQHALKKRWQPTFICHFLNARWCVLSGANVLGVRFYLASELFRRHFHQPNWIEYEAPQCFSHPFQRNCITFNPETKCGAMERAIFAEEVVQAHQLFRATFRCRASHAPPPPSARFCRGWQHLVRPPAVDLFRCDLEAVEGCGVDQGLFLRARFQLSANPT